MTNLEVNIHGLTLKNPIMTASGTFGNGYEYSDFFDVSCLGGIILKATTAEKRDGNPYPRMAETASGMINAVGLQNKGVGFFETDIYPKVKDFNTNVIANVAGSSIESYVEVARRMNRLEHIAAIELNISCPNVKQGGMSFGTKPESAREITSAVREVYDKTLIVKLTPNVTSVVDIAEAVIEGGADAVSLVNTFMGMAIDVETRKPVISTITGGVSGPAIKPMALRMVWQVAKAVKVPVIGIGGISTAEDVVEFLLAGATAVEIGTANFINPRATADALEGLKKYMADHKINDVKELIGGLL
ncbi:MAG: dihydroorotate dehydrogenase [Bacteroidales bacterium]|nr:dihydroorotate dehydrogenase [Bacteroidales bacterium]MBR5720299.1 dihydroorotate dehydrogenase [Bacteroidales bacterium]